MIERVDTFKLLGVRCQNNMKWNSHIKELTRKGNRKLTIQGSKGRRPTYGSRFCDLGLLHQNSIPA